MKRTRGFFFIITGIFLLLLFLYIIFPRLNISQLTDVLKTTDFVLLLAALIVLVISNAFGAFRWSVLAREIHAEKSGKFWNAFGMFSLGQIAGIVVPSRLGNYTKVLLAVNMDAVSYESGLAAVNAETILDLGYITTAGIVSLIIFSSFFYSSFKTASIIFLSILIVFLVIILVILHQIRLFRSIYERTYIMTLETDTHLWKRLPAIFVVKLFDLIQSTQMFFLNRTLVLKTAIHSILFQVIGVLSFILVTESVHVSISFPIAFAILTLSIIAGIISFIPGGLGASDLSLLVLLISQGITLAVATNIIILWRIVMYLSVILIIGLYSLTNRAWMKMEWNVR